MKKTKIIIIFLILFIAIGFATITTSLSINGEASLASNPNDFFVYYSNVDTTSTNETLNINVISETSFEFSATMSEIEESIKINFNVVNSSTNYDAEVSISCTGGDEYVKITPYISSSTILSRSVINGYVTATVQRSYAGDYRVKQNITCSLIANALERDSLSNTPITEHQPVNTKFEIGKEVTIGTETFNVIKETKDYVSLLAQYSLDENYRQNEEYIPVKFSDNKGWKYEYWPSEIDIKEWSTSPYEYIENYIDYLKTELGNVEITGDLITLRQLESLGCTPINDYLVLDEGNCDDSPYIDWLTNNQGWWTKTAVSTDEASIWTVTYEAKIIGDLGYDNECGVRPVITVPKAILKEK